MKLKALFVAIAFSLCLSVSLGQQGGAGGRVTSVNGPQTSVNFSTGSLNLSCSSSSACGASPTSGTISPSSQVVSGTLIFVPTHDASGGIGGDSGGGAGVVQVSCDGGSTWNSVAVGSATLPTTSLSFSYPTPTCTGVTNLNTLLFRVQLGGGGPGSFNMNIQANSSVNISW